MLGALADYQGLGGGLLWPSESSWIWGSRSTTQQPAASSQQSRAMAAPDVNLAGSRCVNMERGCAGAHAASRKVGSILAWQPALAPAGPFFRPFQLDFAAGRDLTPCYGARNNSYCSHALLARNFA